MVLPKQCLKVPIKALNRLPQNNQLVHPFLPETSSRFFLNIMCPFSWPHKKFQHTKHTKSFSGIGGENASQQFLKNFFAFIHGNQKTYFRCPFFISVVAFIFITSRKPFFFFFFFNFSVSFKLCFNFL